MKKGGNMGNLISFGANFRKMTGPRVISDTEKRSRLTGQGGKVVHCDNPYHCKGRDEELSLHYQNHFCDNPEPQNFSDEDLQGQALQGKYNELFCTEEKIRKRHIMNADALIEYVIHSKGHDCRDQIAQLNKIPYGELCAGIHKKIMFMDSMGCKPLLRIIKRTLNKNANPFTDKT